MAYIQFKVVGKLIILLQCFALISFDEIKTKTRIASKKTNASL